MVFRMSNCHEDRESNIDMATPDRESRKILPDIMNVKAIPKPLRKKQHGDYLLKKRDMLVGNTKKKPFTTREKQFIFLDFKFGDEFKFGLRNLRFLQV